MSDEDDIKTMLAELDVADAVFDTDVSALAPVDLVRTHNESYHSLLALGEVKRPKTQRGRDLHSLVDACRVEMARRGL